MKKNLFLLAVLFFAASTFLSAQEKEKGKVLAAKIDKVTLFRTGAQVYQSGWLDIPAGNTDILIEKVSPYINPQSIQSGGKGEFTILSASFGLRYESEAPAKPNPVPLTILNTIERIIDSIQVMEFKVMDVNNRKAVLNQEKIYLNNDKLYKAGSDTIPELRQMLEFYRERMFNINAELLKAAKEEAEIGKIMNDLRSRRLQQEQLRDQYNYTPPAVNTPIHYIIVRVSAEKAARVQLEVNYLVTNAGWRPLYELKTDDSGNKMKLVYKAGVFQNTMVDWKAVPLTLSNLDPNRRTTKPVLVPWRLDYYNQRKMEMSQGSSNLFMPTTAGAVVMYDSGKEQLDTKTLNPSKTPGDYTKTEIHFSNVEFIIPLQFELSSGAGEQIISISNHELPALFEYSSVPKIEKESYLMAKLTGYESFNLLPGEAKVYMGSSLVGSFVLNPYVLEDTLVVGLGRDPAVLVQRKKTKDDTEHKLITRQSLRTITMELTVRNTKGSDIVMLLEDQIPISKNEKIIVETIDLGSASLDAESGLLTWKLDLKPNETRKVSFTYRIIYEKDKSLMMAD
jgi:uncharacterized protein (TIGR02231 family)